MGKVKDTYVAAVERVAADCAIGGSPRVVRASLAWELRGVSDIDGYMLDDVFDEMERRVPGSTYWMRGACEIVLAETGLRCEGVAFHGSRCAAHARDAGVSYRHGSAFQPGDVTRDDVPVRVFSNAWDDHSETGQMIVESGAGWRYAIRYGMRDVFPVLRRSADEWSAHAAS